MPLDSELKRRSAQNYAMGSQVLPIASGAIGIQDRPVLAWMYSDLDYSTGDVVFPTALTANASIQGLPAQKNLTIQLDYS